MDLPVFSLINVHDDLTSDDRIYEPYDDAALDNCTKSKISPWKKGAGIAAFAFRIHWTCGIWAEEWKFLFDGIDEILQVDVCSSLFADILLD